MKEDTNTVSVLYKMIEFVGLYTLIYLISSFFLVIISNFVIEGTNWGEATFGNTHELYGGLSQIINGVMMIFNLIAPIVITLIVINICFGNGAKSIAQDDLAELKLLLPKLWIAIVFIGVALHDITVWLGFPLITLLVSGFISRFILKRKLQKVSI
ncbi:MAG: hypothetical protein FWG10_11390 [Eubacteriaceae bacterium]|nr:hypothetical protein [Eubacteriaceae bacterium]